MFRSIPNPNVVFRRVAFSLVIVSELTADRDWAVLAYCSRVQCVAPGSSIIVRRSPTVVVVP